MLRTGRISETDPAKARVRVAFTEDEVTTGWLQTLHNGANGASWFHTFAINELVAVALESDGVYGFVLGAVYSGSDEPTEAGSEIVSVVFQNGDKVIYNGANGSMELKASGGLTITGDVDVTGTITATVDVKAGITNTSLTTHTHTTPTTGTITAPETTTPPT